MALSWRTTVLADRHRALGSKLEDWNGMGTAWTYNKDVSVDHVAIRTKAGLMDVSGLKKLHLVGPHSHTILHQFTTRDVTKITPGRSAYACMLNDAGHFIEDCILYRTGPNAWMVVHGSGAGHETLTSAVVGRNVALVFDDDLHDLSLQGPLAVEFLSKHVAGIRDLKYFHHTPAQPRRTGRSATVMTKRRESWFDDDAGPLVRPYSVTRGRTDHGRHDLDVITLVMRIRPDSDTGHNRHRNDENRATTERLGPRRAEPEYADILRLCESPLSVAEVAAKLSLSMLVTKILIGDLIDDGHLDFRSPSVETGVVDIKLMRAVLDGIRKF